MNTIDGLSIIILMIILGFDFYVGCVWLISYVFGRVVGEIWFGKT